MTIQAAAGGFINTCPNCDWERWASTRAAAERLTHRCKEGEK